MSVHSKICILYSTAGMGHKKAAMAVYEAFKARKADVAIDVIDVTEYSGTFYKYLFINFYTFLMTRGKWLWGFMYYFSDIYIFDRLTRGLRGYLDYKGLSGLGKMLIEKDYDAIIATHFLLPSIVGILKKDKRFHAKTYTVVTDYGPHTFWLSDDIDLFFVGSDSAAREFVKKKVPDDRIMVTGIPVSKQFTENPDTAKLSAELGLKGDRKTIFIMSGGFGVGPINHMLLALNSCKTKIQVITVCGHNKKLYEDVVAMKDKLGYPLVPFSFTDRVAELMSVSDVMITKAGGISVTEALDARLPMIIYGSIPGQETWNEKFLLNSGAAEKAAGIKDIPVLTDRMFRSEREYSYYVDCIDKVRRPGAAEVIRDTVLDDLEPSGMA